MPPLHKNKNPQPNEFDNYIENYRNDLDKRCSLTGESSDYFAQIKVDNLKNWLLKYGLSHPTSILDFGCGDGLMTSKIKTAFPLSQICGVDPSSDSINEAKKLFDNCTFTVSSEIIPFADKTFDVVCSAGVFHHIAFKDHKHYLQECMRVLKPGGLLILFELNPLNPGTRYIFNRNPIDQNATMLTPWYTKKLTQPAGYKETIFYCFFPHALRILRPLEQWLTAIPFAGLYATIAQKSV